LWNIDPQQEGIVPVLAASLTDKPPLNYDAVHALQHLAKAGEKGNELVNALSKALQESDQMALDATVGLSYLGAGGVPPLKETLRDPRPDVRISAATALSHIGGPARPALSALEGLAKNDPYQDVRSAAKEAITEISADTSP
jgi:HEAT repeat protein